MFPPSAQNLFRKTSVSLISSPPAANFSQSKKSSSSSIEAAETGYSFASSFSIVDEDITAALPSIPSVIQDDCPSKRGSFLTFDACSLAFCDLQLRSSSKSTILCSAFYDFFLFDNNYMYLKEWN